MTGTKWLYEAVNTNEIRAGYLNLIQSPTGSGKSTFALNQLLNGFDINKVVYLIDTNNGREQILKKPNTARVTDDWKFMCESLENENCIGAGYDAIHSGKVVVLTYALFGSLAARRPFMGFDYDLIICDEIHSAVEMQSFCKDETKNHVKIAIERIKDIRPLAKLI